MLLGMRFAGMTRRGWLRVAGLAATAWGVRPRPVAGQGYLANLAPEEPIAATMRRLFGTRPIKDGSALITLELPLVAEDGGAVPMVVEVKSPMTSESHVRAIYILSEKNPRPLNARFNLTPAVGQAYVATNLRLADTGAVRAVAELSDSSLFVVDRDVRVVVAGCAA